MQRKGTASVCSVSLPLIDSLLNFVDSLIGSLITLQSTGHGRLTETMRSPSIAATQLLSPSWCASRWWYRCPFHPAPPLLDSQMPMGTSDWHSRSTGLLKCFISKRGATYRKVSFLGTLGTG